jgi:hypothetical protein
MTNATSTHCMPVLICALYAIIVEENPCKNVIYVFCISNVKHLFVLAAMLLN